MPPLPKWHFPVRQPASKVRDPVQAEFFNTESIETVVDALIREAVQNSLDASTHMPVRLRLYFSGDEQALESSTAGPYFDEIWEHVRACKKEVGDLSSRPCRFLVVEDFNTTGLTGDVSLWDEPPLDTQNDFYFFFRAEGRSGKSGDDRGRWGVGKYVFPMASDINTYFALTRREGEEEPLLMGQAVLLNHQIDGNNHEPDGWWASYTKDELPVPVKDTSLVEQFRDAWHISREKEPGLSIVVPFVDEELTAERLWQSTVNDYYLAVISGHLEVTVESPNLPEVDVTAQTIDGVIASLPGERDRENLQAAAALARWGLKASDDDIVEILPPMHSHPAWDADLICEKSRDTIRQALAEESTIVVRVPVLVHVKARGSNKALKEWSFFDVFLSGEPGFRGKPVYVREGIRVSEVSHAQLSGVRAIVVANEEAMARMLGDAEGPAHTNWSPRTEKFRGKYGSGREWLALVKQAPGRILGIVGGEEESVDRTMTERFFSIPEESPPTKPKPGGSGVDSPGPTPPQPSPPQDTKPPRVRVSKVTDGFSVHLTTAGKAAPVQRVEVEAAYDVRRGNPFRRWRPADFLLEDMIIESEGAHVKAEGNQLHIDVMDADTFSVHVRQFDPNRDLNVRAKAETVP